MATLYLAQDPRLERSVAIKLLKEDSEALRERFAREARTAARLRHVNIVSIFDVDEFDGQPFIAMEYIPGETLAEMIRRRAPIGLARKVEMMADLCTGLAFAHRAGIIHRDIKPANIMVDSEGTLKILDFGIARFGGSSLTQAGTLMGTLNYMSPEQVTGQELDARSDIFAVGAVFYELIAYKQAFSGSMTEILSAILHREPAPVNSLVPNLDPDVVRIVARALDKDLAKRYQDLATMRRDLAAVRTRLDAEGLEGPTIIITHEMTAILQRGRPADTAAQVQALLATAVAALDADDLEAARAAVDKALALDPANADVVPLGARIRTRAAERQSRAWIADAERALEDDRLTRAGELLQRALRETPDAPDAARVAAELERRRTARERELALQSAIASALARAKEQFGAHAFEAALRSIDEVLALAPNHPLAEARAREARAAIADREERERRAREEHERREYQAAEAERRLEERRWLADQLIVARRAIGNSRYDKAISALEHVLQVSPSAAGAAELLAVARQSQADLEAEAERQRQLSGRIRHAKDLFDAGQYDAASVQVDDVLREAPVHVEALELRRVIDATLKTLAEEAEERERRAAEERARQQRLRQQLDDAVQQSERAMAAGDCQNALHWADEALRVDPDQSRAQSLRAVAQEALARHQAFVNAIERATAAVEQSRLSDATDLVSEAVRLAPRHPDTVALELRVRAARTREAVDSHVKAAGAAIDNAAFDVALKELAQARQLEPDSSEVARLVAAARRESSGGRSGSPSCRRRGCPRSGRRGCPESR